MCSVLVADEADLVVDKAEPTLYISVAVLLV